MNAYRVTFNAHCVEAGKSLRAVRTVMAWSAGMRDIGQAFGNRPIVQDGTVYPEWTIANVRRA